MKLCITVIAFAILTLPPVFGQQNQTGLPERQMTYEEQLRRSQRQLAAQAELLEKGRKIIEEQEDMLKRQQALLRKQEKQAERYDRILSAMEKQFGVEKQPPASNK